MGTSLSGLTPATTFDGLLKTSDNEPLDGTLKAISTGDGTDTILQLSNSALKINGGQATIVGAGNSSATTALLIQNSEGVTLLKANDSRDLYLGSSTSNYIHQGIFFQGDYRAPGDWNFGTASDLGAKLGIKGSGATSATTSLLVQNSAGSELFKLTDDGNINLGEAGASPIISAAKNSGKSLKLGNQAHLSAFDLIQFKTWDGSTAYSEVMSITGNTTEPKVGIGETTPTARLHIKGSGNDNTTTSLLVQNSDGNDILKILDDRSFTISSDAGTVFYIDSNGSQLIGTSSRATLFNGSSTSFLRNVGVGETTPTARLQVKGSGATSATTALLVQNSAGTDLFWARDDSTIRLSQYYAKTTSIHPTGAQDLGVNNVVQWHFGNIYSKGVTHITDNTTSSTTLDTSAKLQVDSTTQGFLPPRMTETQRDAITTPAAGLMVYNTTTNKAQCYNGTTWNDLF